jgi:hypothetical protein
MRNPFPIYDLNQPNYSSQGRVDDANQIGREYINQSPSWETQDYMYRNPGMSHMGSGMQMNSNPNMIPPTRNPTGFHMPFPMSQQPVMDGPNSNTRGYRMPVPSRMQYGGIRSTTAPPGGDNNRLMDFNMSESMSLNRGEEYTPPPELFSSTGFKPTVNKLNYPSGNSMMSPSMIPSLSSSMGSPQQYSTSINQNSTGGSIGTTSSGSSIRFSPSKNTKKESKKDLEFPALPQYEKNSSFQDYPSNFNFEGKQIYQENKKGDKKNFSDKDFLQKSEPSKLSPQDLSKEKELLDNANPYGLLSLVNILRSNDPDLLTLYTGQDLTFLGLNLSSQDVLYATFASPFSDGPLKHEPEYNIPSCYYINPELSQPVHKMSLFSNETLFYIFYTMPQDKLQLLAANELHMRDWRYHIVNQCWYKRAAQPDMTTADGERGTYIFFSVPHWEERQKLNFTIEYSKLYNPATESDRRFNM